MKKWTLPTIQELDLRYTAKPLPGLIDELSGEDIPIPGPKPKPPVATPTPGPCGPGQEDLGTCNNPYWAGNGLTLEEAKENNPYWGGAWGK